MESNEKRPSTQPTKQQVESLKEKGAGNTLSSVLYTTNEGLSTHLEHFPIGIIEKNCRLCGKPYIRYAGREYAWGECCSYTCHRREVEVHKPNANSKAVVQLGKEGFRYFNTYPSALEAAIAMGLKKADSIRDCCNGKTKTSAGYAWMWASDYSFSKN